jgi:hypothetical protein
MPNLAPANTRAYEVRSAAGGLAQRAQRRGEDLRTCLFTQTLRSPYAPRKAGVSVEVLAVLIQVVRLGPAPA